MARSRTALRAIGIAGFLAVIALAQLSFGNRWERIHTVDFLQILAAGVLLGITVAGIIQYRKDQAQS